MATTTNYSWTTPDDTALVKDGAAAIRSLGTAIDTTVFNNAAAAIAKSIVDAKGDLIVASADNAVARLAVGTNDYVLTADSTATNGIKWAALPASGATYVGCQVSKSAQQAVSNDTDTAVSFDTEANDSNGFHDNATNNSRLTIPAGKGGKYLVFASLQWQRENAEAQRSFTIKKNGTTVVSGADFGRFVATSSSQLTCRTTMTNILSLDAADYIQMIAYQNSGGTRQIEGNDYVPSCTSFGLIYLGA